MAEYYESEKIFGVSTIDYTPFILDINAPLWENAVKVYESLKMLTPVQALDERIWTYFTLDNQIDYMCQRWPLTEKYIHSDKLPRAVNDRYFIKSPSRDAVFRNGIARLWWLGKISVIESKNDPYKLLKVLCSNETYIMKLCEKNLFANQTVMHGILSGINEYNNTYGKVTTNQITELTKSINIKLGVYSIDSFSMNEVKEMTLELLGVDDCIQPI